MIELAADPGVGLRHDEGVRGGGDVEEEPADVGVPLGVEGGCGIAAGIGGVPVQQNELEEGRELVSPGRAAIERPVVAAMVEPDAGIVLPGYQVRRILRIGGHYFLGLTTQRTILVHANVRPAAEADGTALGAPLGDDGRGR